MPLAFRLVDWAVATPCASRWADEQTGVNIIRRAIEEPLRQIVTNAGGEGMKLNDIFSGNFNAAEWEAKGYELPKFDIKAVREKTAKQPTWVHFGGVQEIYDERARELAFEGHRWYDLRRTTQPALTRTYGGQTYTLTPEKYTMRFPTEAVESNPEIERW